MCSSCLYIDNSILGIVTNEVFKKLIKNEVLPSHDPKYETLQNTVWHEINDSFYMCCKFDPNVRPRAIEVLNGFLKKEQDTAILKSKEGNI